MKSILALICTTQILFLVGISTRSHLSLSSSLVPNIPISPQTYSLNMALQLKKNKFRLSTAATGALVLGAGILIIKTFPHLKASLLSRFSAEKTEEEDGNDVVQLNEEKEIAPEDLTESLVLENKIPADPSKWCDTTLKNYLKEKEVSPPPNASRDQLVSIVKSIQQAI